jgi:hypothetical protein
MPSEDMNYTPDRFQKSSNYTPKPFRKQTTVGNTTQEVAQPISTPNTMRGGTFRQSPSQQSIIFTGNPQGGTGNIQGGDNSLKNEIDFDNFYNTRNTHGLNIGPIANMNFKVGKSGSIYTDINGPLNDLKEEIETGEAIPIPGSSKDSPTYLFKYNGSSYIYDPKTGQYKYHRL